MMITGRAMRAVLIATTSCSVLVVSSCAPENTGEPSPASTFSKSEFGDAWPYVEIESATIDCEMKRLGPSNRPIATMKSNGQTYALNGAANSFGYPFAKTLSELDEIEEKFGVEGNEVLDIYGRQRDVSRKILDQALSICRYDP